MKTNSFITLFRSATVALLLIATAAQAEEISGVWSWTTPGRNGGPERTTKLTLKAQGATLTGKVSALGRDGENVDTPISDATVDGDSIAFSVVRSFNGNSSTNKYTGKVSGDAIKGKSESVRNGNAESRDWEAKRVTDTK